MNSFVRKSLPWLVPVAAALAFGAVLVAFARHLVVFKGDIGYWARQNLTTQAGLAAANLVEPVRTQDFRRIGEIAAQLKERGMLLTVYSPPGGVFYRVPARSAGADMRVTARAGDYTVELGYPEEEVFRPFRAAVAGFALAALVGGGGMFVVFFALYRQRVRIRELARLERFRREFIADASHELKTPLTGVLGAVEMLEEELAGASPAARALTGMIRKESDRLNALTQGILDLARLERAETTSARVETDVAELVGSCVAELGPAAAKAGVALRLERPDSPLVVRADPTLLAQAVSNLIANAIRHSGSPEARVAVAAAEGTVRIVVEDRGKGIAPEQADAVFERFHRVDPARAAESGGAGLGLAIVRRIARLHGGDVTLEAVSPHGCRFVIAFPEFVA